MKDSIVIGGGCFWCLDALYKRVKGVTKIISGYAGGRNSAAEASPGELEAKAPTYEEVCSGRTGHAEVVELEYDPALISLEAILKIFFEIHDPTTPDRQGDDVGSQYRSIILYKNGEEKAMAEKVRDEAQAIYKNTIVTEILPLERFYPAESYHQDYYAKNPDKPYCVAVISPKLEKFLKHNS